ncbi:zinc ribbon domain-containing protein [Lachnospiraceae bacterium]|nr:zinc ribbon domain-containing protein [Lachnospiraceae bacterium]
MDFFNKLGDAISGIGKDVSQNVADLTGIARLNMDIRKREDFVKKQYTEIGRQYYDLHKGEEEPFFEEINLITEALQEIEQLKVQIADLKGKKKCPVCGAVNEGEAMYCIKCGARCESVFEDEDVQETEKTQEEIILDEVKEETE